MEHYRASIKDYEIFDLGDFRFQSGQVLPNSKLAYKTYGELNSKRDNAILIPVPVNGSHESTADIHMKGDGRAISPKKHFVIIPNMFGNGLSSSPSNTPPPFSGPKFPDVTIFDNVIAQHKLITEVLGISKLKLVTGFSMGGLQTYHWAAMFPDMVENFVPICGTAKCSTHNWLFLESLYTCLKTDPVFSEGNYSEYPIAGMKAFCAVYAAWLFSQEFFRQGGLDLLGLENKDDLVNILYEGFIPQDPNDLLTRIKAWQNADISANDIYNSDLQLALRSITAKGIIMPSSTDQYFWSEDNRDEVKDLQNAEYKEIPSIWGHGAGGGRSVEDMRFVDRAITELIG
tara:strand:- start:103 stop:1134 length:1032 start_codon:yes stop_codon:yes gene_type:complete